MLARTQKQPVFPAGKPEVPKNAYSKRRTTCPQTPAATVTGGTQTQTVSDLVLVIAILPESTVTMSSLLRNPLIVGGRCGP